MKRGELKDRELRPRPKPPPRSPVLIRPQSGAEACSASGKSCSGCSGESRWRH